MKVLVIITTAFVPYGGLTTVIMNYYKALDKRDLIIDIASTNEAPVVLREELRQHGSNYYALGNRASVFEYCRKLREVLNNGYDVVHVNGNSATMVLELLPAKHRGIPNRIAHVHTTKTQHPILQRILYPVFKRSYSKAVAVSDDAGRWLYNDEYTVLNNAIDTMHYAFSPNIRHDMRLRLGIEEETFVLGNVGKLNAPKNHHYLLQVYRELKKTLGNSKLLIVGGGELEEALKRQAIELGIEKDVLFTGMVDDTCEYIQAFDYFAFPSKFEGLGLALIEAQASGLRCIVSDRVPHEAIVSDQVMTMSILEKPEVWAKYIVENMIYDRESNARNAALSIRKYGYDISVEAKILRSLYLSESV